MFCLVSFLLCALLAFKNLSCNKSSIELVPTLMSPEAICVSETVQPVEKVQVISSFYT